MNHRHISMHRLLALAIFAVPSCALAQAPSAQAPAPPSGPAAEVSASYRSMQANILKAADKMPADAYSFKPTPDIRTFGRVVNHITEAQLHYCNALLGTPGAPATAPAETASKDEIVAALKASFATCDKAYASLSDASVTEAVSMGRGKRTRIALAWGNYAHDDEQYATLSLYLRLKGLVPPTSEK